ncbi:AMP-dependent synthetase [Saccharothrix sp. NRRL B-16348]|jgi:acyl-CoA synthetase (AMP-forming)/AMP-acid ligase II|uniref:AMP-binding protein n=1 Tax=Saccharothrix sp. NRRL B-16348 TaxID=1415542 RepID=UPI0006AFE61B|nr:AMP-binding protein [Saccharothrix sp. NRRL B-16348]KOX15826.1 AMP-dependent synthetase [Saccharothrix sp. NRRL B-16348]
MTVAGPDVEIPQTSLTSWVLRHAEEYGSETAIVNVSGSTSYTFAEMASQVRRAAHGLRDRGFRKGDVVGILAPNVPEYPIAFHAAALAGGTVVALNPLDTSDDLVARLEEAGARFLVTVPHEMPKVSAFLDRTDIEEVIVLGEAAGATPFSALVAHDEIVETALDPSEDVVTLLHSSGSTGLPKGVLLTHRNMIAKALLTSMVAPSGRGEKALAMPPFHHAFGLSMMMNASLHQGTTLVTMERFDPEGFLRAIEEHRITRLYIVPTIAVLLAKSPLVDRFDLSSLRSIVSGGASLDPQIARLVRERIGCEIGQGYGMTEAMCSFMQTPETVSASVGQTAPGVECKIVDVDTGEELGRNRNGEILVRGPHVMKGYLNAPEATRQALEPDGFLHTGDLGYVDDNGELFIVDRIKELIKYKGQQVSPVELEAVLMRHPKIVDAAVIGVPDEESSEIPKGFIVTDQLVTAQEIMDWVAERVAPYKKIRQIEFIDKIPRTPVGKIERRTLSTRATAVAG